MAFTMGLERDFWQSRVLVISGAKPVMDAIFLKSHIEPSSVADALRCAHRA